MNEVQLPTNSKENSKYLSLALKVSNLSLLVFDLEHASIIDYNSTFLETFKYIKTAISGKSIFEVDLFFDLSQYSDIIEILSESGEIRDFEVKLKTADKSILHVKFSAALKNQQDGKTVVVATLNNITEYKSTQIRLRNDLETTEAIIKGIPFGVIIIDGNSKIRTANSSALEIFGKDIDKLIGLECHDEICSYGKGACPVLNFGKKVINEEKTIHRSDGQDIPILKTVIPIVVNGENLLLESFVDISNIREYEKKLEQSEENLRKLFSTSPIPMAVSRLEDGKLSFINHAMSSQLGYSQEDIKDQLTPNFYWAKSDRKIILDMIKKDGFVHNHELKVRKKNGEAQWALISINAVTFQGVESLLFAAYNITERKKVEKELKRAKEEAEINAARNKEYSMDLEIKNIELNASRIEAEAANRAKSEFLANMSHEIRTPMNSIIGFTSLIMEEETNPENRKRLEIVGKAGKNLLDLINDILDFSKIEAGRINFNKENFSPLKLFEDVQNMFTIKAEEKKLNFEISIEKSVPIVLYGDEHRIYQIILNLVNNAIKFTTNGGITINVKYLDSRMIMTISDTGIGVEDGKKELIFSAFRQADSSTTRKYGGTGLGLAITKKLVEGMSGTITVQSSYNQGSSFIVAIPLAEVDLTQSEEIIEQIKFEENDDLMVKKWLAFSDGHQSIRKLTLKAIASLPCKISELSAAVLDRDKDRIKSVAHNMKGFTGNYGIKEIFEM